MRIPTAEQVEKERQQQLRRFLTKLRADLISMGADRYLVHRMTTGELLVAHERRTKALMDAPAGHRFD